MEMQNSNRSALNADNIDFDNFLAAQSGQDVPEVEGANFVKLMQSNSPELDSTDKRHVPGIRIGDFLFRGASPEVVRSDEGFLIQMLAVQQAWAEWNDDGVNVFKYATRPAEAIGDKMPNGNSIEFTKYLIGAIAADVHNIWVIPLKSTGLGVFNREIARPMRMVPDYVTKDGHKVQLPIYAHLLRVTSRPDGNAKGKWRAYHFEIISSYPNGITRDQVAAAYEALRALPNLGPPEADVLPPPSGPKPPTLPPAGDGNPLPTSTITPVRITPANENVATVVEMREFAPINLPDGDDIPF
jgi:hypothetical protein